MSWENMLMFILRNPRRESEAAAGQNLLRGLDGNTVTTSKDHHLTHYRMKKTNPSTGGVVQYNLSTDV